jgi:hypothetical protein
VLGVPTTLVREARRFVSRDETTEPSQSFTKAKGHPSSNRIIKHVTFMAFLVATLLGVLAIPAVANVRLE